jgi:FkbM family methyltransferase
MRFYGQFQPPVDQFLLERYFKDKKDGIALECGAFDGQLESSCKFFEESMDWRVINIEASPPIFKNLIINRPKSTNFNLALSNKEGTAKFAHVISPEMGENFGNGSLSHLEIHKKSLINEGCKFVDYEVKTITYKKLIESTSIKKLNLMVLDVEGHELSVIEGMIGAAVLPEIFCIEHGHLGVEKIKLALSKLPYKYDTSLHINSFYIKTN